MPLTKRQSEALYILHKYTYIKLMGEAIEKQDSKCVTLHEIYEYLRQKDAFFRGEYVGWKNYVIYGHMVQILNLLLKKWRKAYQNLQPELNKELQD
uniref:Fork-head domain-containing protein n=1 Tax=Meloidogyne javanica TaxID=6303 RepID=A0A915LV30_MELJA